MPFTLLVSAIFLAPPQSGCCFLWMDDGSRSTCAANLASADACENYRAEHGWDRRHYFTAPPGGSCACESAPGKSGGPYAVYYELDVDDLDKDNNRKEMIRWKFVVSVQHSEVVDGRCRERHRLVRGWSDREYT